MSIVVFWFILAILSELLAPAIGPDASMAVALVATSTGAILLHKRRQRKSVETQQRERFREENTRAAIAQRRAAIARRRPQPRLFRTAREAEELARDWMRYLGYLDAEVTPVGADAGIDVIASEAIGQVKAQAVSTNRPVVQQTYGAAVAEGKNALVFSLAGFTSNAIDWAEDNQIALFEFNYAGEIEPSNWVASQLLDDADSQAADAGPTSTG